MDIKKNIWVLPSKEDGEAFVIRTQAAERDLCEALDLLQHIHGLVPHRPSGETKGKIEEFLKKFKK